MRIQLMLLGIYCLCLTSCNQKQATEALFNDNDLSGWTNVLNSPDTWRVAEESIHSSGTPTSFLRSDDHYENFILSFELNKQAEADSGSVIIHSDALPAPGKPLPRGILINGAAQTSQHALLPVNGAKITPSQETGAGSNAKAADPQEWDSYRIESRDGKITLTVNGKTLSEGTAAVPRKGYISLVSGGSEARFRNIQIAVLPSSNPGPEETATVDEGFVSLYNGTNLSGWDLKPGHRGHWTAQDWVIDYDGKSEERDKSLWTTKDYRDFVLMADVRFTREPTLEMMPVVLPSGDNAQNEDGSNKLVEGSYAGDTGIYLRGNSKSQVNMGNRPVGSGEIYGYRADKSLPAEIRAAAVPKVNADNPPGEWNRFIITMEGDRVTIILNDQLVIDDAQLPGIPETGPIALQDDHADNNTFQFANLFIKELD